MPFMTFRIEKPERSPGQAACVDGGHLQRCRKILAFRSSGGRVRRSAARTEPEERWDGNWSTIPVESLRCPSGGASERLDFPHHLQPPAVHACRLPRAAFVRL